LEGVDVRLAAQKAMHAKAKLSGKTTPVDSQAVKDQLNDVISKVQRYRYRAAVSKSLHSIP